MATDIAFEELLAHLKRRRTFDFTGCTRPAFARRIGKRMQAVAAPARGRTARDTTRQLRSEVLLTRSTLFTRVEPRRRIFAKAAVGTSEPSA